MKKKNTSNCELRFPYNQEQRENAKRVLKNIDIAALSSLLCKSEASATAVDNYSAAKKFIQKIAGPALRKIGIRRKMSNFSKDFPLNTLLDWDSDAIARMAANILKDEIRVQNCQSLFDHLFGDEFDNRLVEVAKQKGKTPDALTQDEIHTVASTFLHDTGTAGLAELLHAQNAVEIFAIAQQTQTAEDFSEKEHSANYDWINYFQQHYHTRTKAGGDVNINEVETEASIQQWRRTSDDLENSYVLKSFINQSTEEEKRIMAMKANFDSETKIAAELGYKSQGTISKKIKKMKHRFKNFHT